MSLETKAPPPNIFRALKRAPARRMNRYSRRVASVSLFMLLIYGAIQGSQVQAENFSPSQGTHETE